ncbi:hypothetical protein GA0061080_101157, partial [Gilliamella intestini]
SFAIIKTAICTPSDLGFSKSIKLASNAFFCDSVKVLVVSMTR